jgi:acyl-CoA synthetase (AMP-forming)/AMP-acid ligase II
MEVAVFGIQDEKWGETPIAAVTLTHTANITAGELVEWTNGRVSAKFQRIHQAIVLDDFPRNAAGKTMKRTIRDNFLAEKA